ncbi:MAG: DUF1957 domain-containing protein, partial [Elusimicrobiales bacterium]|nr:DUF1957 domain-containing protein [Elusimicrobiales bacterium]
AQSSDWAFLMYIGSHVSYVEKRFTEHINDAADLLSQAIENNIKEEKLKELEIKNNIFPQIDFRLFASPTRF